MPSAGRVKVELFSLDGRLARVCADGPVGAGQHVVPLQGALGSRQVGLARVSSSAEAKTVRVGGVSR